MVFFKPDIGVVELRRSGGDFITLDTFLMRSMQDVTATEEAWALLERDTANHEKLRKLEEILLEKSVNHLFDKDIVPRLPGCHQFFKPALKMAARTAVTEFVPFWTGRLEELVDKFREKALDLHALENTFDELSRYKHLCKLHLYKATPDGKSVIHEALLGEDAMPEWEQDEMDTWRYVLTCHSIVPFNIRYECPENGEPEPES
mmetsp:Transcript_108034/g.214617  ORF Transcript_108034/g.214617 Transcript_108034/m.214617 type:complete len:204 (+) Transcript_108034:1-612(+)